MVPCPPLRARTRKRATVQSRNSLGDSADQHCSRPLSITSFGEDARGELYVVGRQGEVFKFFPILPNLQVSGEGAELLSLQDPDWIWEDLNSTSSHPITQYRVYCTVGNGSGTFDCVFQNTTPIWPGGDLDSPAVDQLFSYLVTALNAGSEETDPGAGTDGTPRTLSTVPCPP